MLAVDPSTLVAAETLSILSQRHKLCRVNTLTQCGCLNPSSAYCSRTCASCRGLCTSTLAKGISIDPRLVFLVKTSSEGFKIKGERYVWKGQLKSSEKLRYIVSRCTFVPEAKEFSHLIIFKMDHMHLLDTNAQIQSDLAAGHLVRLSDEMKQFAKFRWCVSDHNLVPVNLPQYVSTKTNSCACNKCTGKTPSRKRQADSEIYAPMDRRAKVYVPPKAKAMHEAVSEAMPEAMPKPGTTPKTLPTAPLVHAICLPPSSGGPVPFAASAKDTFISPILAYNPLKIGDKFYDIQFLMTPSERQGVSIGAPAVSGVHAGINAGFKEGMSLASYLSHFFPLTVAQN